MERIEPKGQVIEDMAEWPIYKIHRDRKKYITAVASETFEKLKERYSTQNQLVSLISKAVYMEKIRVKTVPWKADPANERLFWKKMGKEVIKLKQSREDDPKSQEQIDAILGRIIYRYSEEIIGNFKIKTFKFARKFLTALFNRLLNATAIFGRKKLSTIREELYDSLNVYGPVDDIRNLLNKGTIVILPTHSSNLDSILVGYAMDAIMGLPAFTYGAGLNLYGSETVAYFMNRLGAYRVDRRKKNPVYLETLKAMSKYTIAEGTHSLFFPGGTRSRSGILETKLKMGLLGTVIEAQRSLFQKGKSGKIFIVPCVISYHCVLEANQLINQHLAQTGRENFEKSPRKMFHLRNIIRFAWQLFNSNSSITLSFGQPMDVLGNYVNTAGESLDDEGQPIEIQDYFKIHGETNADVQREQVYTRHLASKIAEKYLSDNLVLTSHLVAFAAFELVRRDNPNLDVFGIVRLPEEDTVFEKHHFIALIDQLKNVLLEINKKGGVRLSPEIHNDPVFILEDGIRNLGILHVKQPLKFNREGNIISQDFKLLYFYHNRLVPYSLLDERQAGVGANSPKKGRREVA